MSIVIYENGDQLKLSPRSLMAEYVILNDVGEKTSLYYYVRHRIG